MFVSTFIPDRNGNGIGDVMYALALDCSQAVCNVLNRQVKGQVRRGVR